jgi:hypothetical protein
MRGEDKLQDSGIIQGFAGGSKDMGTSYHEHRQEELRHVNKEGSNEFD